MNKSFVTDELKAWNIRPCSDYGFYTDRFENRLFYSPAEVQCIFEIIQETAKQSFTAGEFKRLVL